MELKLCSRCGKYNPGIHTCTPELIRDNLKKSIERYNDKLVAKEGSYAEDFIYMDIYDTKYKKNAVEIELIQDFIDLFLNKGFRGTFEIDDNIGMIVLYEGEVYLNEFNLMKKYGIKWDKYIDLYYDYIDYRTQKFPKGVEPFTEEEYFLRNREKYL